jgi:hypothetical protein
MADPKTDLNKFLTDPAHQAERDFLFGALDAWAVAKAKKAEEERNKNGDNQTFLQRLFDGAPKP